MENTLIFIGYFLGVVVVASLTHVLVRGLCEIALLVLMLGAAVAAQELSSQMAIPFFFSIPACGVVLAVVGFPLFMVFDVSRLKEAVKLLKKDSEAYQTKIIELEEDLAEVEEELDSESESSESELIAAKTS